jgi:hypothetical protein
MSVEDCLHPASSFGSFEFLGVLSLFVVIEVGYVSRYSSRKICEICAICGCHGLTTDSHRFSQKMQKAIKKICEICAICGCHGGKSIFDVGRDAQRLSQV